MNKIAFSQYVSNVHASDELRACIDEIDREIQTRKRLYDRWVAEGKCTWQEAHDRMTRLMGAQQFLVQHVDSAAELKLEGQAKPY